MSTLTERAVSASATPRLLARTIDLLLVALVLSDCTRASFVFEEDHGGTSFLVPLALLLGALAFVERVRLDGLDSARRTLMPVVAPMAALASVGVARALSSLGALDPAAARSSAQSWAKDLLLVAAIVLAVKDRRRLRLVAVAATLSLGLIALPTVVQRLTRTYSFDWWGFAKVDVALVDGTLTRQSGGVLESNSFAQWLVTLIPLAVGAALLTGNRGWQQRAIRLLGWSATALGITAVLATRSRMGAVSVGVVLVAMAVRRSWRLGAGLIVVLAVAVAVTTGGLRQFERYGEVRALFGADAPGDSSAAGYASTFRAGLRMFADHPVTGVGSDNFEFEYLPIAADIGIDTSGKQRAPHNAAVEVLSETGIVGAAAIVAAMLLTLRRIRRATSGFVASGETDLRRLTEHIGIAIVGYSVSAMTLNFGNPQMLLFAVALVLAACTLVPPSNCGGPRTVRDGRGGARRWVTGADSKGLTDQEDLNFEGESGGKERS